MIQAVGWQWNINAALQDYVGYNLRRSHGLYESFEREYYDMMRSAFLKYNFQVRIGNMDGLLVAYHNTQQIFGFQYISREEISTRLFGNTHMGDMVLDRTLQLFHHILDVATKKYPKRVSSAAITKPNQPP